MNQAGENVLFAVIDFRERPEVYHYREVAQLVHNVDGATFNRVLRVIDDLYLEHFDVTFAAHGSATVTALASEICESSPELWPLCV